MKKIFLLTIAILVTLTCSYSQILKPVKWSVSTEQINAKEIDLVFSAAIDKGWHMYGLNMPDGGPFPVSFNYDTVGFEVVGKPRAIIKAVKIYDDILEMNLETLEGKGLFKQKIRRTVDTAFTIKGYVEYMACNDKTCTPPIDTDFDIKINAVSGVSNVEKPQVMANTSETDSTNHDSAGLTQSSEKSETELSESFATTGKKSLWGIILLSILGGLGALLTPCVYPMIPLTISFFMRGEKSRSHSISEAFVFGISIILIYTLLGVLVAIFKDPNAVNAVSTNWLLNSIFFVVFILLALSFFGLFEIVLPAGLTNRIDQQADKGGILGAFFMALGMTILSFSCTGPIVASLLIKASEGEVIEPVVGMFSFGLIFAIPFTLFAIFPSWLKSIPKSGGWLNSVKASIAFIMLAFSFYFLNKIDQAYHLNILSREIYIGFWIVIFSLLGFYLLGKIRFAHDSESKSTSVLGLMLAIVVFTFVMYLVPGLFGAELKGIAPLLPPKESQQFDLTKNNSQVTFAGTHNTICGTPKYVNLLSLPLGLEGYFDYNEAIACAKEKNKPVFIDFVGHTCANCKKMYENVWSDPSVLELLQDKFIIVALYTDDKTKLPKDEWYTSTLDNRVKNTIGKKNVDFQIQKFNSNALPLYAIIDTSGNVLTKTPFYVYHPDIENFRKFLLEGLNNFNSK